MPTSLISTIFTSYCRYLTRFYLPLLGVYRIKELRGVNEALAQGPAIFVANHRGRLDGPMLLGIIPQCAVLIKSKYAKLPLYSIFVKYLGFIGVSPHDVSQLSVAVEKCKEALVHNKNILIFPEGARSTTQKMLSFKDFAFRIAKESGFPIIPVVIHTDLPFMTKTLSSIFPKKTLSYTIRFGSPLYAFPSDTPGSFADRVHKDIRISLQILDKNNAEE